MYSQCNFYSKLRGKDLHALKNKLNIGQPMYFFTWRKYKLDAKFQLDIADTIFFLHYTQWEMNRDFLNMCDIGD